MVVGRRISGRVIRGAEAQFFAPKGRYFRMKEKRVEAKEEKKKQKQAQKELKRDWKMLQDARVIFNKGMEKARKLSGKEKVEFLKRLDKALKRRVDMTWSPAKGFANKEQSRVYHEISVMWYEIGKEIERSK